MYPKEFYLVPEELFRLGNSNLSKLNNVRSRDVNTIKVNGVIVIVANGKGINVFDREGINESPMNDWVWRFPPNTQPPVGLKLVQDKPYHYCITQIASQICDSSKGVKYFRRNLKYLVIS